MVARSTTNWILLAAILALSCYGCGNGAIGGNGGSNSGGGNAAGGNPAGGNPAGGNPAGGNPAGGNPAGGGSQEICGNQLDDNGNGDVDERCACKSGDAQPCFLGTAAQKGKGICKPGQQRCVGSGEFQSWGSCENAQGPKPEICGDGVDQDCDGKDDPCPASGKCETFTFGVHSRPVDIVWAIDQSGSMSGEISMVRQNINAFASFISRQKVDYHVIIVAARSHRRAICVPQPLGGPGCSDGPRLRQIDAYIGSHSALSQTMAQIAGVEAFMRPSSIRHFVAVTDDESRTPWGVFHSFLLARQGYKDYVFHSIVGMKRGGCVAGVGNQYMALSNATKGIKAHICNAPWQQVFNALAQSVASATLKFKLSQKPLAGSITVSFGGSPVQQGPHWKYDPLVNQIIIVKQPHDGTKIKVCYKS